jgi:hypothetical protein
VFKTNQKLKPESIKKERNHTKRKGTTTWHRSSAETAITSDRIDPIFMAAMAMETSGITIRVRSSIGMWRFSGVDPTLPTVALQQRIESEKNVPIHQQKLSLDPKGATLLDPGAPLLKFANMTMIFNFVLRSSYLIIHVEKVRYR